MQREQRVGAGRSRFLSLDSSAVVRENKVLSDAKLGRSLSFGPACPWS